MIEKKVLLEDWQYNEWPDVDINGNVIEKKSLKESIETCPKCGKAPCECDESCKKDLKEADEEVDTDTIDKLVKDDAEEEAVANLKDALIAALDAIEVPEDEELDSKVVLDAIVNRLADEDREYLCSVLCPKEEANEEESAEEAKEEEIPESED